MAQIEVLTGTKDNAGTTLPLVLKICDIHGKCCSTSSLVNGYDRRRPNAREIYEEKQLLGTCGEVNFLASLFGEMFEFFSFLIDADADAFLGVILGLQLGFYYSIIIKNQKGVLIADPKTVEIHLGDSGLSDGCIVIFSLFVSLLDV